MNSEKRWILDSNLEKKIKKFNKRVKKKFLSNLHIIFCPVGVATNMLIVSYVEGSSAYDPKLHLIIKLQFWRSSECEIHLHWNYSQIHFKLERVK